MKGKTLLIPLVLVLVLGACATKKNGGLTNVSAGKSATVALGNLAQGGGSPVHPSGTLGVFSSLFLSQRVFLPARTGVKGIDSVLKINEGNENPLTNETYLLLLELGNALSVDVVDTLNRSNDRLETLNRYTEALKSVTNNSEKEEKKLKVYVENNAKQMRVQRDKVQEIEKVVSNATKAKDFATVADKQNELSKEKATLSGLELRDRQTKDAITQFDKLIELAKKRMAAIDSNRELLLSGLSVRDVEGLEDLGVVKKSKASGAF